MIFLGHRCFVQLDKSVQIKLHKYMKKKFILGNCDLRLELFKCFANTNLCIYYL